MPALLLLIASLVLNYLRHRRGKSTICSTTRPLVPAPLFVLGMAWFNAWFIPHWLMPKLRERSRKAP